MSPQEFRRLSKLEQLEALFEKGSEILGRFFLFYNIHLYIFDGFYVEVWYHQVTNKVDKIIILTSDQVLDIYERHIGLNGLTDPGEESGSGS